MIRKTSLTLIVGASLLLGGTTIVLAETNGATLAQKCERCHGKNGNSDDRRVPSIAGFSTIYFVDTMMDFKRGKRQGKQFKTKGYKKTDMNAIAKRFNKTELNALGEYFAAQTFIPRKQNFDPALARQGEKLYKKRCSKCHEDNGSNPDDDAGLLAGQWTYYLKSQLLQFYRCKKRSCKRKAPRKMMKQLRKLKKGEPSALLHFFASQQ